MYNNYAWSPPPFPPVELQFKNLKNSIAIITVALGQEKRECVPPSGKYPL